jgi:hypothetical protein
VTGLVDLIHADIPFPVQFRECVFTDAIWLKAARLRSLIFRGGRACGLNADTTLIETNVLMVDGFESKGEVSFREASVGGGFRTDGGRFFSDDLGALVCDRIKVSGGVFLSQLQKPAEFHGEVRFSGADVGGNFDCEGAYFSNLEGRALSADRIRTGGSLFLRNSTARGEIIVGQSRIGSVLDCRGASFESNGERTLNAERANVGSNVLIDLGFVCDKVHFLSIVVQGSLRSNSSRIGKLDLRYARVEGMFEWTEMVEPSDSHLDLRGARFESIKDDEASWPGPGAIQFDGLRFERFADSPTGVAARLRWLALDPSNPAQAYRQLSRVYDQAGEGDASWEVLFAFERLRRSHRKGILPVISSAILRWTVGYGYKLWRAGALMLLLTAAGFVFALLGYRARLIAPSDKDANAAFVAAGAPPAYYPRFSASMYSIEHSLPALSLGVAGSWSADTSAQWPRHPRTASFIRYWFWIQTLFGWVLSVFFVAGLTGIVKSTRSP